MDARALERQRPAVHGVVSRRPAPDASSARRTRHPLGRVLALLLFALVATALLTGIAGGLRRVGLSFDWAADRAWLGHAALSHAALMMSAFMGTVIAIERAVALKQAAAWLAPFASAAGGVALLGGHAVLGAWLHVAAAVVFTGVNVVVVQRQQASHTWLLLASAGCWLAGNLAFALGWGSGATLPWWFAFLVITIAAERLEMTRLMRRRPAAQPALALILAAMTAGAAISGFAPAGGGVLFGGALVLLAAWLFTFDIARRTLFADGLPRYMAVCLLGGYGWLALGGLAWGATALGLPARDTALHALGLGFIVSMMMGHAPVILPAIARVKLLFGPLFYLPLAALHLSLAVRLGAGWNDFPWRAQGALFNALAIALFAATVAGAALAWRTKHGAARADGTTP